MRELDIDGKIERFRKRYGTKKPAQAKAAEEPAAEAEPTAEAEAPAE
jgi:hypothetical protein